MLINKPMKRLKRLNSQECLWPYILKLVSEKPVHAYVLRERINKKFRFLPGMVTAYTTLYSLYLNDFVSREIKGRRTVYKITPKGRIELKKAAKFYKEMAKKLG